MLFVFLRSGYICRMKKTISLITIILFNLAVVFLLLEVGVRALAYFSQESIETFESSMSAKHDSNEKKSITGEITLGRLIQKSSHPGRVYEFKPNIEAHYIGKHFETNRFGMRERDVALNKEPGVRRIAGIGDSVQFAWGVLAEDSYLRVVERKLVDETAGLFETLNFAVPGYNTAMEVDTYEHKVRHFKPDILVLHFLENDFGIPLFMSLPPDIFSMKKSFLVEKVKELFLAFSPKSTSIKSNDMVGVEFNGFDTTDKNRVIEQYQYMLGHKGFALAMTKLARMTCEDKVPVVVLVGRLQGDFKDLLLEQTNKYGFHLVEAYPFVNKYVKENQIENTPQARKRLLWINDNDPHPNELGHTLYAEALMPKLREILAPEYVSSYSCE